MIFSFILSNLIVTKILKSKNYHTTILALVFVLGVLITQYAQSYTKNDLYCLENKYVTILGYVYEIPTIKDDRFTYFIKTEYAIYDDEEFKAEEIIRINSDVELNLGQNVKICGILERFSDKMNYSDFDYARYYKSKNVFYRISDHKVIVYDTKTKDNSLGMLVKRLKLYCIERIDKIAEDDLAGILKAVTVGFKKDFSKKYSDLLLKTNTNRMLFPTYLHILLIMWVVEWVLYLFHRKWRDVGIVIVLLVYALINSESPIALKNAMLVVATIFITRRFGYSHYPDIVSGIVFFILLFNPLLIYNSGFLVSITVGWLFFMIREPVEEKLYFIGNYHLRRIATSWVILTIGILPLSAYYFNSVNIYGVLLNFIYFPIVVAIIFTFWLFMMESTLFSGSFIFKYVLLFLAKVLYKLPYFVEKLPFSHINLPYPGMITLVLGALLVVLIKSIYVRGRNNIKSQVITAMILGTILSVILMAVINIGSAKLTFVNVGQGDGAIIELPKGEKILVDGGGSQEYNDFNAGEKIFLPYLKSEGHYKIDMAIVTHFHSDHCLGIIKALEELEVGTVAMPDVYPENEYRIEIERLAKQKGTKILYLKSGDKLTFKSGAEIKVISPSKYRKITNENDTSIVFVLECNGVKALFTGDISLDIELDYLEQFDDVDILKVAHHGSKSSTTYEFLYVTRPEYAVISSGEENQYLHPNYEVINRLKSFGSKILKTSELGDIRINIRRNGKIHISSYYEEEK